jgi:hypothetical protein
MEEQNEGVGVTDSVSTDTPLEAAQIPATEEVQTVDADQTLSQVESSDEEIDLAEGAEGEDAEQVSKLEPSLQKHFRKVIASKDAEIKRLSSNALSEADREAVDLYQGLTSFDNERGIPSAKPFAQKLIAKDPALAFQVGLDLFSQPDPNRDGWSLGHSYLEANGIDPTRLDDVRSFLKGESKLSYQEIPEYVPQEFHEAFKSCSPQLRENLEYQLASDDEKQAALEVLQDKQWRLDQRKSQEETQKQQQENATREIYSEVENGITQTFTKFVDDFQTSPTYTNVQVSSDPLVDEVIKSSINQMMLNLSEPNTVAGQQAAALFKKLNVNVNLPEVEQYIGIINGSIETSVRAGKGGHQTHKAQADAQKQMALQRLQGIRNNVFAQAVKALAGQQQAQAQAQAQTIANNAGLPSFGNSSNIGTDSQKISTLDWIKQRANKP